MNRLDAIRQGKLLKKWDILALIVLVIALISSICMFFQPKGSYVDIYQNGKKIYTYKLEEDRTIIFKDGDHTNTVVIKGGKVCIISANCHNQICVNSGSISKVGSSISCVPHKLTITIRGEGGDWETVS